MSLHYLANLLLQTYQYSTFSKSLMVFVGASKLGKTKTDLIFVDPGVKINGTYYLDVL